MESEIRALILEDEEIDPRTLSSSEPLLAEETREIDSASHHESHTATHHRVNRRLLLLSGPALLLWYLYNYVLSIREPRMTRS